MKNKHIQKMIAYAVTIALIATFFTTVPTNVKAEGEPPGYGEWLIDGNGTYFEIINSSYLNVTLSSSENVHVLLESIPNIFSLAWSSVLGNVVSLALGTGMAQALMAVATLLVARQLGAEIWAEYISCFGAAILTSVLFNLGLDNWLLRLFAPNVEIEYDMKNRRLMRYQGISMVSNSNHKSYEVVTTYDYSQQPSMLSYLVKLRRSSAPALKLSHKRAEHYIRR